LIRRNILDNTVIKELPPFQPRSYNISRLFEDAIQNRPELKALRVALRQTDLGIRLARSQYYPKVYLMGRYEREGDNLLASNNDFANQHNARIGMQVSWPLFESGKKHAEVTRAIYQEQVLAERIKGIKDSILLEVRNACQGLKVAEKKYTDSTKGPYTGQGKLQDHQPPVPAADNHLNRGSGRKDISYPARPRLTTTRHYTVTG